MDTSCKLVQRHAAKNTDFLLNNATDVESQLYNFDPKTKDHGMAASCISRGGGGQNRTIDKKKIMNTLF
jgi:hypothetical protein